MYAGEKLSDYGMMLCSFNSSSMETISIGHKINFNTVLPIGSDRYYLTHSTYEEPLSTTFQICKSNFRNNNFYLTTNEMSSLTRWLGRKDGFHQFRLYQKGYEDIFFKGAFNSISEIKIGGNLCGLEITFTTDSPYGYLDTIQLDFSTSASMGYNISNLSYEIGHIYPNIVQCKCLNEGNLMITNAFENRITIVNNCSADEIITFDGQNKIITSSHSLHNLANDFNYNYFRLVNKYNDSINTITTSIPCEFHIEYNPIRKVALG